MEKLSFNRRELRVMLVLLFRMGYSASKAHQAMCEYIAPDVISQHTVELWFNRFRKGDFNLDDKPISGAPSTLDEQRLLAAIEINPSRSTRDLTHEFGCSKDTINRHLHSLGKVYKYGQWIPHDLTESQLNARVHACISLQTFKRTKAWLCDLVTGDEKYVLFVNHTNKRQWLGRGETGILNVKSKVTEKKVMIAVFWDIHGIVYWEFIPEGTTMTAKTYCNILEKVALSAKKRHDKVYLLHDNAKPHTALMTREKIMELEFRLVPHPPYSPDIAPSDYHLFRSLQNHLGNQKFDDLQDLELWLNKYFSSLPSEFYKNGIMALPKRWDYIVDNNGLYINEAQLKSC